MVEDLPARPTCMKNIDAVASDVLHPLNRHPADPARWASLVARHDKPGDKSPMAIGPNPQAAVSPGTHRGGSGSPLSRATRVVRSSADNGLAANEPVKSIAARINKSYQAVCREVARNRKPDGSYQPWFAHNQAHQRRRRPKLRLFTTELALREVVAAKLVGLNNLSRAVFATGQTSGPAAPPRHRRRPASRTSTRTHQLRNYVSAATGNYVSVHTEGEHADRIDADGWTLRSTDSSRAALVKQTIAVTDDGPVSSPQPDSPHFADRSANGHLAARSGRSLFRSNDKTRRWWGRRRTGASSARPPLSGRRSASRPIAIAAGPASGRPGGS